MLDPIFKNCDYIHSYLTEHDTTRHAFLRKMYVKYVGPLQNVTQHSEAQKTESYISKLAKKYSKVERMSFESEVNNFMNTEGYSEEGLLDWWSVHKKQYVLLSQLARVVLQITATSANVERLNSRAGSTLTKFRLALHHNKVEKIMSVYYNFKEIE